MSLHTALNHLDSAALCLSGGGIRSAAFALGIVQALAAHELEQAPGMGVDPESRSMLSRFHYLSTVSGGGYIGGWLTAWRARSDYPTILKGLAGRRGAENAASDPLTWLRSYSSYLTPKTGAGSADTWTAVAITLRNLLLNWSVMVFPICAALSALKILGILSNWVIQWNPGAPPIWMNSPIFRLRLLVEAIAGPVGMILLGVSLVAITRSRPTRRYDRSRGLDEGQFLRGPLTFSLLAALSLSHFIGSDLIGLLLLKCRGGAIITRFNFLSVCQPPPQFDLSWTNSLQYPTYRYYAAAAAFAAILYATSWLAAWPTKKRTLDLALWAASGVIYGVLFAVGLVCYLLVPDEGIGPFTTTYLHLVFGVPWLMLCQIVADMCFVGLSSYEEDSESDREWFARANGWFLTVAAAWTCLAAMAFFGQVLIKIPAYIVAYIETLTPSLFGFSIVVVGYLGRRHFISLKQDRHDLVGRLLKASLFAGAALSVVVFLMALSYSIDAFSQMNGGGALLHLGMLLVGCVAMTGLTSTCININRFSLHSVYRNRLVRAFLGASRTRTPDAFTLFDAKDNPSMHELWSAPCPDEGWRPFLVINIALNVVSTDRLDWQERKARPFTVTALHCGSSDLGYRDSRTYGGPHGLTLGTAMAISGAAVSPNMGYNSSPLVTFLMTVFNVRLGWWLGNPGVKGDRSFKDEGPAFAISSLAREAFGRTTDTSPFVYLSDGGHFENLGLYEMVRRRCRYILISDATCDPDFDFVDLGNAVRKISIDLGVEITFSGLDAMKPRGDDSDAAGGAPCHAFGTIDYVKADGVGNGRNGRILYVKAGYHDGSAGVAIRSYARRNRDFPHENTFDQWFTESQFESYRSLGMEIMHNILNGRAPCGNGRSANAFADLFEARPCAS